MTTIAKDTGVLTLVNIFTVKPDVQQQAFGKAGAPDDSKLVTTLEGKGKTTMPPKTAKFHPKADEIALARAAR